MNEKPTRKPAAAKPESDVKRLRDMPDSAIDYSDIPETDAAFWADARVAEPAGKTLISIRVDRDVLQWYRANSRRYQTLMNAVLRSYMEAQGPGSAQTEGLVDGSERRS